LTVTAGAKAFQVTIVHCSGSESDVLKLSVLSSETGQWGLRKLPVPAGNGDTTFYMPSVLGQSGTSYWILEEYDAVAYNSSSVFSNSIQTIPLPPPLIGGELNRCIGERHGGGGHQYAQSNTTVFEVWWESDTKWVRRLKCCYSIP
jgi:hypothetical protein